MDSPNSPISFKWKLYAAAGFYGVKFVGQKFIVKWNDSFLSVLIAAIITLAR